MKFKALLFLSYLSSSSACPDECYCIGTIRITIYCDYRGLTEVPAHIPIETAQLYLNGNKFDAVVPRMFMYQLKAREGDWIDEYDYLPNLRVIRLDGNPIMKVNEHALESTPNLHTAYFPIGCNIQREVLGLLKLDGDTFTGFHRVPRHPLEDPNFIAFAKHSYEYVAEEV